MGAPVSRWAGKQISKDIRGLSLKHQEPSRRFFSDVARAITRDYPNSGFTEHELADEIAITAVSAGVAVKIGANVVLAATGKSASDAASPEVQDEKDA